MKYKRLGKTGLLVSELTMGTMTFGRESDQKTCEEIYYQCRESGINCFDCADMYADGLSEKILGALIKKERSEVIITTKAYFPMEKGLNNRGLSRRHLIHSIENSLTRLATDRIDIFYFHHFDQSTDLEESLRATDDLIKQGKILYLGASNFSAWQVMKGLGISLKESLHRFSCIQPMYNLLKRQAEVELFPMAQSERLGVFGFGPLAAGLLTGKFLKVDQKPSRLLVDKKYQLRYAHPQINNIVERFINFAWTKQINPIDAAIAWTLTHPAITSSIIGARNLEQLKVCLNAVNFSLSEELRKEMDALTPSLPHPMDRDEENYEAMNVE